MSELESRSPDGSTAFRMDLAKDFAAAAAPAGESEPPQARPVDFPAAAVGFLGTAPLCCWKSSGGRGGRSGVAMMRSRSLKRTLFSELLEPLLLPEELPGLPVASLLAWNWSGIDIDEIESCVNVQHIAIGGSMVKVPQWATPQFSKMALTPIG